MKKFNQITTVIISLIVTIFISGNIFADISGSSLIAESSYLPGETNTIGFRCDWVTSDDEWAYTIAVHYKSNMFVTAGYKGYGNQYKIETKGEFSFSNAFGEAVLARWDSDENIYTNYGGISNGKSGYFTNDVYISPALTGDIVLTYFLIGDGWNGDPDYLTNTLILKEWFPSVKINPSAQTISLLPGKTGEVFLSIINDTASNDNFNISYDSLWGAVGPVNSGLLTNKSNFDFAVSLSVPNDVAFGQVSTTTVTVVNSSDFSFTNSAIIIVKCLQKKEILLEEFIDWPPEGWTQYSTFGTSRGWIQYNNHGIVHGIPPTLCSNWFVSPPINLNIADYEKVIISFSDASLFPQNYKYTALMVSNGDGNPSSNEFEELFEMTHSYNNVWVDREIDASEYIGSNPVYFAFLYAGANGHQAMVKDVSVYAKAELFDNVTLNGPATVEISSYDSINSVTGLVEITGKTGTNGPATGIIGQFGYGHSGILPDSGQWSWQNSFLDSSIENIDYYITTSAVITAAGNLNYALRFKKNNSDWVYADLDGSSNKFSADSLGKLSVAFPKLYGSVTYRQTMQTATSAGFISFEDGDKNSVIVADDFSPLFDTKIKTVRWKGTYHYLYPRDGSEKGFNIFFYENSIDNGTNLPSNILYSEFFPGYASELLSNNIYSYQVDLQNQFDAFAGSSYWFAVQNTCTNISRWAISNSADPNIGNTPAVWSPSILGHSNWVAGLISTDLGFEFFAVVPKISLKGNSINITNGDDLPTATDGTDFGQAEFDLEIITNSFTIENSGSTNLTVSNVSLTTGTSAFSIFSLPMSDFVPNTSSTFQIIFDPLESGIINGTVSIENNDENPFVFAVSGEGIPEGGIIFSLMFFVFSIFFAKRKRPETL